MNKALSTCGVALVMSVALIGMPACAKKSVQSGGDSQSTQGTAKGGADSSKSGVGSFPDTGVQSQGGGLRGLDKNPSEERVGSGTMLAKVDPSSRRLQPQQACGMYSSPTIAGRFPRMGVKR